LRLEALTICPQSECRKTIHSSQPKALSIDFEEPEQFAATKKADASKRFETTKAARPQRSVFRRSLLPGQ
jgi:hypothetical protein